MTTTRSNAGRWARGSSGNPRGRPRGTARADRLRQAIDGDLHEIIESLVNAAKLGDVGAARLILERCIPALKPQELPVAISIEGETLSDQARSILAAVATGQIAVTQGGTLLSQLSALARVIEIDEIEQRLRALESGPPCLREIP